MGDALFLDESIRSIMLDARPNMNGYFTLRRDVPSDEGALYDVEMVYCVAGEAKSWGSGMSEVDRRAGRVAAVRGDMKVVPFLKVEEATEDGIIYSDMHELYKQSGGLMDVFLLFDSTGGMQYEHSKGSGVAFVEPKQIHAISQADLRKMFSKQDGHMEKARAELSSLLPS